MTGEQRGGTASRLRRSIASATLIALGAAVAIDTAGVASGPHHYRNPVSRGFAAAFAQPSVIRANDGLWYAIGASGPLRTGEETHLLPIARSRDLVSWSYVGDVFDPSSAPDWAASSDLSGPDLRYVNGRYVLLYAAGDTNVSDDGSDGAVGVAFAPTPAGPWRDSGVPLVPPRERPSGGYLAASEPSLFTTPNGDRVLYYRSGPRAVSVVRLTDNARSARGRPTVVARGALRGPFALRRGRRVVLLATRGSCCAGPASAETIVAGRAAGTRGPFVDKRGISLMSGGGSLVLAANGNRWLSTGHGSQVTDLAGGDWLAFHAVPRSRPYLDAAAGAERRSLLLDRIRWRDGWPLVRAGRWASQRPQRAPVTTWDVGETFGADTSQEDWVKHGGRWRFLDDRVRGSIASCREAYLTSSETISGSQRVEADLRTIEERAAVGLVAAFGDSHRRAVAWIDDAFDEFLLSVEEGGALFVTRAVLPPGFRPDRFHRVVLELNGPRLKATLLDAGDAVAVLHALNLARRDSKRSIGVAVACGSGEAANVGGTRLRRDPAPSVRLPSIGKPVARLGDEFDGDELAPTWSWVREPAGETGHGVFRWRTQVGDLGASDTASVLLRAAPRGRFTVETKLRMSSVEGAEVSSPHAGLIAYRSDDLHVMLTRGHPEARPIVFAKDLVTHGIREHGAMPVTRSAKVTWLRLVHRVDPHNGEHQYRSAVSPDGAHWDWGATWTLPRGRDPRIGLVSLGGRGAIARFDYFRVLRP